jgi:drug/metabolite transporter (DMT)-like permease
MTALKAPGPATNLIETSGGRMRAEIVGILQTRMDKCTTEQFWAVAAVATLNAYLLSGKDAIRSSFPVWAVLVIVIAVAGYAIYFVVNRHTAYVTLGNGLADLLADDESLPAFLRERHDPWKSHSLSGFVFYCGGILVSSCAVFAAYL